MFIQYFDNFIQNKKEMYVNLFPEPFKCHVIIIFFKFCNSIKLVFKVQWNLSFN